MSEHPDANDQTDESPVPVFAALGTRIVPTYKRLLEHEEMLENMAVRVVTLEAQVVTLLGRIKALEQRLDALTPPPRETW